jgi:hypothetical protein
MGSCPHDSRTGPENQEAEKSPSLVFRQIQQLFQQWKIFNRKLSLEHEGLKYLIIF